MIPSASAALGALLCVVVSHAALAQHRKTSAPVAFTAPEWVFPGTAVDVVAPKPPHDTVLHRQPGSTRAFTLAAIKDRLNPPDWAPESHPGAPDVVMHARPAATYACGFCHLPTGQGRSENATIAGLPAEYIVRQLADFRSGARGSPVDAWGPFVHMREVAQAITDAEAADAARYFANIRATARYRVVERDRIPAVYAAGGLYAARPGADSEPLGHRLIEMSNDIERHEDRDPGETFTTFVPSGAVARGRRIATSAQLKSPTRCVTCHGPDLRGAGAAPPIAGRSPAYTLRQLIGVRMGARHAEAGAPMRAVVAALTLDDMIAVAAYAGSRAP
ncbi:MAG: c-type cytochrome [bacterium]